MSYFKPGDWAVICDLCGRKRKASECRKTWEGYFACADTCWYPKHPQLFVKAKTDRQSVPIARPDIGPAIGETAVKAAGSLHEVSIDVDSISNISDGDPIGIELDNGAYFWTYVDGTPSGNTVSLGSPLPHSVAIDNTVHLPAVDNETYITATGITATEL